MSNRSPKFSVTYVATFFGFWVNPRLGGNEEMAYGVRTENRIKRKLWEGDHHPALPELTNPLIDCLNFLYGEDTKNYKSLLPQYPTTWPQNTWPHRLKDEEVLISEGRSLLPGKRTLEVVSLEDILALDLTHQPIT